MTLDHHALTAAARALLHEEFGTSPEETPRLYKTALWRARVVMTAYQSVEPVYRGVGSTLEEAVMNAVASTKVFPQLRGVREALENRDQGLADATPKSPNPPASP